MIKWIDGCPEEIKPGMLLHFECGNIELIGTLFVLPAAKIRRYCQVVPTYWLEWADSMANHIGHQS